MAGNVKPALYSSRSSLFELTLFSEFSNDSLNSPHSLYWLESDSIPVTKGGL